MVCVWVVVGWGLGFDARERWMFEIRVVFFSDCLGGILNIEVEEVEAREFGSKALLNWV